MPARMFGVGWGVIAVSRKFMGSSMPSLALGPGWTAGMTWRAFSNLSVKIRNYLPSQENALKGLRNIAQGCRAAATLGGANGGDNPNGVA
uniref:Uncharacterized protein n=1 Tax=Candidatus Kentrum sp. DK TaxID=2126562 RepID=A0A450S3R3_9GAMM|nr:MAG: hypothetical protein BECKDK2373B_GA0170837_10132 [Candidatus Kentron sp. DK]VFJ51821.1 MAG: hypothetical protein BECKDK2373C_GA0170839_10333 [Candidatus Kentron sp. DK]